MFDLVEAYFTAAALPDIVNGIFESFGGFFIGFSVVKLYREKIVRGISWAHAGFFSSWGLWNLYFYPHLDQWFSFAGGVILVATNAVWLSQIVYYNHRNKHTPVEPVLPRFTRTVRYRHSDK